MPARAACPSDLARPKAQQIAAKSAMERRTDSQDPNGNKRQKMDVREDIGWGSSLRGGRGRGWGRGGNDGHMRGFMSEGRGRHGRGDFGSFQPERAGWHRGGRHPGGFPNDNPFMHHVGHIGAHGALDPQHQLPMPPQQQHMDDGHVPGFHGHQTMQGDGPAMSDSGHLGQHPGSGPHRGRGRGWGRGGSGSGGLQPFRRGQAGLDPAVLERRRKSTAAIIARQLAHVHVSESLAGQKGFLHYQRSSSALDNPPDAATRKGLPEEEVIKHCLMYSAVASEENVSSGVRAHDPLDAFELCLDDYTMSANAEEDSRTPGMSVALQTSKFGTFLAPSLWES